VVHPRKDENHMNLSILAQLGVLVQVNGDEIWDQRANLLKIAKTSGLSATFRVKSALLAI
jgi:hypothetical protein